MASFFDGRDKVLASTLAGPRVYSTDIHPTLFNADDPHGSVEVTARALKIKIITKGIVTLNCASLVSPLGVLLLREHPDLLEGDALLPAFRVGKQDLRSLLQTSDREFRAVGIDQHEFD